MLLENAYHDDDLFIETDPIFAVAGAYLYDSCSRFAEHYKRPNYYLSWLKKKWLRTSIFFAGENW